MVTKIRHDTITIKSGVFTVQVSPPDKVKGPMACGAHEDKWRIRISHPSGLIYLARKDKKGIKKLIKAVRRALKVALDVIG